LDQRLDSAPVGIIGEIQLGADVIHYALLHLRRIEIAATAKTTTASAKAPATTTAAILSEDATGVQHQRSRGTADY
jgi:hypothetical protein